jgi:hypothetical protein
MALEQLLDANAVGRERVIATAAKAETQVVRGGRIFPDRGGRGGPSWSAEEPCRDDCGLRATPKAKKASTPKRPLFGRGTVLKTVPGGTPMIDPSSKLGRELKPRKTSSSWPKMPAPHFCRRIIAASLSGTFRLKVI